VAFVYLWISLLIVAPVPTSIVALTFASNALSPFFPCGSVPDLAIRLLAACAIRQFSATFKIFFYFILFLTVSCSVFLTFVNCASVLWSTRVSEWTSLGKVGAMITIVCAALFYAIFGRLSQTSDS
jgi:amino acid transporter